MENKTFTCQICGRTIKAGKGVIAHHGYKRPDYGWQTSSCMGARHLPYEISCDVLPVAIEKMKAYLANERERLEEFTTTPPAFLNTVIARNFSHKTYGDVPMPDGFTVEYGKRGSFRMSELYALEYSHRLYAMQSNIKSAIQQIEYLESRLKNWKAQ